MDYEKRYKDALNRARTFVKRWDSIGADNSELVIKEVKEIFPELKESEDERIRKEIVRFIRMEVEDEIVGNKWLAWLEKQDKHDITEPKFKVGDWVIFNNNNNKDSIYRIEKVENYQYTLRHILGGSMPLSYSSENMLRHWTIEDAKDGDILYSKEHNLLWCYKDTKQCYYCTNNNYSNNISIGNDIVIPNDVRPASKKQRDLLFQKMKEIGMDLKQLH